MSSLCKSVNGPTETSGLIRQGGNDGKMEDRWLSQDVQTTAFHAMKLTHRVRNQDPSVPVHWSVVWLFVCVHVSMQPCMVAYKQTPALALRTTAAEKGFSRHLSPPTISLFLFFLSPTYSSFHQLFLLLLSLMTVWPLKLTLLLLFENIFIRT